MLSRPGMDQKRHVPVLCGGRGEPKDFRGCFRDEVGERASTSRFGGKIEEPENFRGSVCDGQVQG